MSPWKILYIDPRDGAELPYGYIDENNKVSGIGKKAIKQCLLRHGWPETSPIEVYAGRSEIRVVEVDPHIAESKGVLLSRPKDKSLEGYKAWIMEMYTHLTGKSETTMSEAEWEQKWNEFWSEGEDENGDGSN